MKLRVNMHGLFDDLGRPRCDEFEIPTRARGGCPR